MKSFDFKAGQMSLFEHTDKKQQPNKMLSSHRLILCTFQTPANLMYLLEILWKPESQVLSAMATVLLLTLYAMDGWFFGYYNTKLRRRYAKLFGCRPKEVEHLRGVDNTGGDDMGPGQETRQQRDGQERLMRRAWVGSEMSGGSAAAGDIRKGRGTRTCGTVWVVPQVTGKIKDAQANSDIEGQMIPGTP